MILERQWQYTLQVISTEISANVIKNDEGPMVAAKRERKGETEFGEFSEFSEFTFSSPNPSTINIDIDIVCHDTQNQ